MNNNSIYKLKIGTDSKTKLGETYDAFVILGNKIYFSNEDSSKGAKGLASIDLNGGSFKSYTTEQVGNIQAADNYIYYTISHNIYQLSIKNGTIKNLGKADGYYINVYNGYVYFSNKDGNLSRISINNSNKEISDLEVYSILCIVNNKLYSRHADGFSRVKITDMSSFKTAKEENQTELASNNHKPISTYDDYTAAEKNVTQKPTPTPTPEINDAIGKCSSCDSSNILFDNDWDGFVYTCAACGHEGVPKSLRNNYKSIAEKELNNSNIIVFTREEIVHINKSGHPYASKFIYIFNDGKIGGYIYVCWGGHSHNAHVIDIDDNKQSPTPAPARSGPHCPNCGSYSFIQLNGGSFTCNDCGTKY